jgi:flagellin-like hook-associated protein FlgL
LGQIETLAIPGLQPSRLGGSSGTLTDLQTGGSLAGLGANAPLAVRVADEALAQLARVDARVDGFANVAIASSSALLSGFKTNLQDAIDSIDKVDPISQMLIAQQNQALAANAIAGLTILNQQRENILSLLEQIAFPAGAVHL